MDDSSGNISRSGRVRKKSSKLADFESPDDLDQRFRRKNPSESDQSRGKSSQSPGFSSSSPMNEHVSDEIDIEDLPELDLADEDDYAAAAHDADDFDDDEERELLIDDTRGQRKVSKKRSSSSTPSRSNANNRVSAYLLWAKSARASILREESGLSSAELNQRLAEEWRQEVGPEEKEEWRKKAVRKGEEPRKAILTNTDSSIEAKRARSSGGVSLLAASKKSAPSSTSPGGPGQPAQKSASKMNVSRHSESSSSHSGLYKVVGTEPLDAAAHLKLLGESLTIIGERLTEHEGQIAVSGSLSVLLDSLLCAMGPLLCLTQQVPELNVVPQETLNKILDNVAYIMPGL